MDRLRYIDILKGLSILCIMLLHYENGIFPGWLNVWIGNFMIAAFYFSSGWLAGVKRKKISVKKLAKKRWQTLGKPYIYFSILILLFDVVLWVIGHYDLKFIAREIYKTITMRGIGTLWFLPALFGGEIIFRYLLNKNNLFITFIALLLSLAYINLFFFWQAKYRNLSEVNQLIDAPLFTINNILYAWPIIGFAYLTANHFKHTLTKTPCSIIIGVGIIVTGTSIYVNGGFCPFSFDFISPLVKPVIGPLGLLLIAYPMSRGIIINFLSFWGVNSLVMMVTHYSILLVICQIMDQAIFYEPFSGVRTLVWFVVSVIAEYPIVWFFNNKAKWMLGKS